MQTAATIQPQSTLADLATTHAAASRVFHHHGLDFCCGGQESLASACERRGIDLALVLAELELELVQDFTRWDEAPLPALIDHLLERFHEPHRAELPRLIAMAEKVESVHSDKPACPRGLATFLRQVEGELEDHMQKEEHVLFPLIRSGRGRMASMPVQVLETEHRDHARNLERLREMTASYTAPSEACNTWRALYLGLAELERDLMQHIHLENNVLFPRALRS
jgi:regulator of cell morphogenesis and NO signaling